MKFIALRDKMFECRVEVVAGPRVVVRSGSETAKFTSKTIGGQVGVGRIHPLLLVEQAPRPLAVGDKLMVSVLHRGEIFVDLWCHKDEYDAVLEVMNDARRDGDIPTPKTEAPKQRVPNNGVRDRRQKDRRITAGGHQSKVVQFPKSGRLPLEEALQKAANEMERQSSAG